MKRFLQNLGKHFSQSFLGLILFILPSAFLFTFIFSQPTTVKTMLRESELYTTLSSTIGSSLSSAPAVSQQAISSEVVENAVQKVISPSTIQSKVETLIDDIYAWLYGKEKELSLKLDLTQETQQVGSIVARETILSLQQKPVCTTAQLQALNVNTTTPPNINTLSTLPCQPPGIDYVLLEQQAISSLQSRQSPSQSSGTVPFAPGSNPTGTSSDVTTAMGTAGETVNATVPVMFQIAAISFYIVIVCLVLIIGIMWLLLKDSVQFYGRLAKTTFVSGILLVLYAAISLWLLNNAAQLFQNASSAQINTLQSSLRPFAGVSITVLFVFGGLYVAAGIGFMLLRRHLLMVRTLREAQKVPTIVPPTLQTPPIASVANTSSPPPENQPTIQEVIRYNKDHD